MKKKLSARRTTAVLVGVVTLLAAVAALAPAAYKVIAAGFSGHPLAGWKTVSGKFEAPEGYNPYVAVNGSKKIKYAIPGG
jgi:hypothetical protein